MRNSSPQDSPAVSYTHLDVYKRQIARQPQGYFLTHVEGASFPVLNGKTLDAQAHRLDDHDVIELAGVKMEFFVKT